MIQNVFTRNVLAQQHINYLNFRAHQYFYVKSNSHLLLNTSGKMVLYNIYTGRSVQTYDPKLKNLILFQ